MRWLRYVSDGESHCGILEGDEIAEISGDMFAHYSRTGRKLPLGSVTIDIPLIPRTFYTAGINYLVHARQQAELAGTAFKLPEKPDVNYRGVSALTAHDTQIVIPKDSSGKVQFEGELVVVIGRQARNLTKENALSCVFGYTIGNDVSERRWQGIDRTLWRAKNSDTFKPMGPWIETDVELDRLHTTVRLNGQEAASFRTNDMLFGVADHLSLMSRYMTLYPGDVLWMGTDLMPGDMVPGDSVEVEIAGIGTLRNRVGGED
ncbi:MAG: fumarylacetoacetate hydrolase family protein [Rhizobiaceae bacterium]|nr:fumarylacetoacetate hydrolase family protein [Rhizobiaceae bacterium]